VEKWTPTEFSQNHQSFFFNEMPEWAAVHWVHMHNMDDMMMRRLGVKFRLHPLALEDAMVPVVDAMSLEQRPKAEKFKEHLFFIIPRVRSVRARKFQSYLTFSCFNYMAQIRRTSLAHISRKPLENQRSNANSIMTKTELALRARTQVRLVYETRRKRRTVVKMTNAARSVFWFLCCIPRLLFGCVSRCCQSCHRICIPPSSRDRRRGRHRRHSRKSSRTRFDSVPYTVLLDDEVTLNGLEEGHQRRDEDAKKAAAAKKKAPVCGVRLIISLVTSLTRLTAHSKITNILRITHYYLRMLRSNTGTATTGGGGGESCGNHQALAALHVLYR